MNNYKTINLHAKTVLAANPKWKVQCLVPSKRLRDGWAYTRGPTTRVSKQKRKKTKKERISASIKPRERERIRVASVRTKREREQVRERSIEGGAAAGEGGSRSDEVSISFLLSFLFPFCGVA